MKPAQTHSPSLICFLLFAAAALLVFTVSFLLAFSVPFSYISEGVINVQSAIYSVTVFFTGVLLGTASIISLLRFMDKPAAYTQVSTTFEGWKIAVGVLGAGLALLIGNSLRENQAVNWLVLPLLTIPAVVLPIWTLAGLAIKDLSLGTRWRTWGALGISLTVTPFILFILETLVVIAIFIIVVFYVVANPNALAEIEKLSSQLAFTNMQSEEGLRLLMPYLAKPAVVIPAALFFSIIVPLMEELIKPLVVWVLARRLDSAAQGFAFGALSGAGFALWESFNASGQIADWGIVLFTRIGTGLLHITTTALMGSAIFMAIREKRYLRLLGTYLLVVLLHGLWNASAITVSFSSLSLMSDVMKNSDILLWVSTIGLVVLVIMMFTLLVSSNRKLHKSMLLKISEETAVTQTE